MNHFLSLILFALLVSLVLSLIAKEDRREVVRYFLLLFAAFVLSALAAAWLMYPFPFGK